MAERSEAGEELSPWLEGDQGGSIWRNMRVYRSEESLAANSQWSNSHEENLPTTWISSDKQILPRAFQWVPLTQYMNFILMKPGTEKPVKPAKISDLKRGDTIKFAYLKLLRKQNHSHNNNKTFVWIPFHGALCQ